MKGKLYLDSFLKHYINMWCALPSHHPSKYCRSLGSNHRPRTSSGPGTQRQNARRFSGLFTLVILTLYLGSSKAAHHVNVVLIFWIPPRVRWLVEILYGYKFIQEFIMGTWIQVFLLPFFVAFQRFGGTLIYSFLIQSLVSASDGRAKKHLKWIYRYAIIYDDMCLYIYIYIYVSAKKYICDSERSTFVVSQWSGRVRTMSPCKGVIKMAKNVLVRTCILNVFNSVCHTYLQCVCMYMHLSSQYTCPQTCMWYVHNYIVVIWTVYMYLCSSSGYLYITVTKHVHIFIYMQIHSHSSIHKTYLVILTCYSVGQFFRPGWPQKDFSPWPSWLSISFVCWCLGKQFFNRFVFLKLKGMAI